MSSAHGTRCASTTTPLLCCARHTHTHTRTRTHRRRHRRRPLALLDLFVLLAARPLIVAGMLQTCAHQTRVRGYSSHASCGPGRPDPFPAWGVANSDRRRACGQLSLSCTQPTRACLPLHNVGTLILLAWELHQAAAVCCRSLACRPARGAIAGTEYRQGPYQRLSAARLRLSNRLSNRPPHLNRIIACDASHYHCQR
jgi:hypothetical protein